MTTTFNQHKWPGLTPVVLLPDWIEVEVRIIPSSVAGWTSGTKSNEHTKSTWHDTGNDVTAASGEYSWAARGGRAEMNSAGSYNGIFDGNKVIIAQRFDEVVGHAYNNTGNVTSYAFEQAFGPSGGGFDASWKVGCWVHAGLIVAKVWQVDTSLVMHQYWPRPDGSHKRCPGQILNRNLWSATVAQVSRNAEEIRASMSGTQPTTYAKASIIPELDAISKADRIAPFFTTGGEADWVWVGDRVRALRATARYQRASGTADRVGPNLKTGEEFDLDFVTFYSDEWWGYTPAGTRIRMVDVERIADMKGA